MTISMNMCDSNKADISGLATTAHAHKSNFNNNNNNNNNNFITYSVPVTLEDAHRRISRSYILAVGDLGSR